MQIRLYIDEDAMARALVTGLRARGVDVTTVLEAGMSEQDDMAQLEYASQHGRVLYTFNVGGFLPSPFAVHSSKQEPCRNSCGLSPTILCR
jgi:hypothetical protein